ncbi:sugar phosphate isomerase/epimerase [candidate division WOR-3 bacterium]|nr:sugar phosphate isomerase/epimerase [candidate division WOR-3 bacterium]
MISIGTTFNYDITLEDQLPMIRRAGFSHVSLGARIEHSNYLKAAGQRVIRGMVEDHGLAVCSVHTPLGEGLDISSPDNDISDNTVEIYQRCIEAAQFLCAGVVIFHPTRYMKFDDIELRKKTVVRNVERILGGVGTKDVKLAIENDRFGLSNDVLAYSLDEIIDTRYGLCYDSSHDNLVGRPLALLEKYGSRLLATHISDNHGEKDDHLLPFEGSYDWPGFYTLFSRIPFRGIFLLEVEMRESMFKQPEVFLREAFTRGERILSSCRRT